jgi:hypothetical protein
VMYTPASAEDASVRDANTIVCRRLNMKVAMALLGTIVDLLEYRKAGLEPEFAVYRLSKEVWR